jgi:hypothetical protein
MCQKSALQCQLTCLYVLYTVNHFPSPLAAIHIVMRAQKILYTKYTKCCLNYQYPLTIAFKCRSDSVVQWIRAGMVWERS